MSEASLGHEVISLKGAIDISTMNADGYPHDHVLRTLCDTTIDSQEVGSLQSLEAEAAPEVKRIANDQNLMNIQIVVEVAIVDDCRVQDVRVGHDHVVCIL
jgi:hypothetical protein